MKLQNEDEIILNTIANCVNQTSNLGPFRDDDAKSTFNVPPKLHRKLEIVAEYTGLTKQEIYTKAVREYVNGPYLKDIDVNQFKTQIL